MPHPTAGESKAAFVSRFMESTEAQSDYPEQAQRYAVATSLFEHRNALKNAKADGWPRKFKAAHLEPGLVRYDDIDPPGAPKGTGSVFLLRKPALDKMRNSLIGRSLVNNGHKEVEPADFQNGKADGILTGGFFGEDGWDWVEGLVWNDQTKADIESKMYGVSNAYVPTDIDWTPGEHHNMKYDGEILDGRYTHLAIVPNPRYVYPTGPQIMLTNSKDGGAPMLEFMLGKDKVKADPEKVPLTVDGKKFTLANAIEALKKVVGIESEATELAKAQAAFENAKPEDEITLPGGTKTTKAALMSALKNAEPKEGEDEEEKKKKKAKEEEGETERKNSAEKAAREAAEKEALENAGAGHFARVLSAIAKGGEMDQFTPPVSAQQQLELGRKRYGTQKKVA